MRIDIINISQRYYQKVAAILSISRSYTINISKIYDQYLEDIRSKSRGYTIKIWQQFKKKCCSDLIKILQQFYQNVSAIL
jgi:hypothetical protein